MTVLRVAGKIAAQAVPVAQLARLGLPALIAGCTLAVCVLALASLSWLTNAVCINTAYRSSALVRPIRPGPG
jgi:hypothetical protein